MTITREEYLLKAVEKLGELFNKQGYDLPAVNVSCSWPGGGSARKRIGECWARKQSQAEINEIFISPSIEDSARALDILTHELVHAIDDCAHGHRKEFTKIMRAIGLEGKPTETVAGERLNAELIVIIEEIGEYPHKKLTPGGAKQQTRQRKAECNECGAIWRMSKQWLDLVNCCPCCKSEDTSTN